MKKEKREILSLKDIIERDNGLYSRTGSKTRFNYPRTYIESVVLKEDLINALEYENENLSKLEEMLERAHEKKQVNSDDYNYVFKEIQKKFFGISKNMYIPTSLLEEDIDNEKKWNLYVLVLGILTYDSSSRILRLKKELMKFNDRKEKRIISNDNFFFDMKDNSELLKVEIAFSFSEENKKKNYGYKLSSYINFIIKMFNIEDFLRFESDYKIDYILYLPEEHLDKFINYVGEDLSFSGAIEDSSYHTLSVKIYSQYFEEVLFDFYKTEPKKEFENFAI